jgi:hypothetical protein
VAGTGLRRPDGLAMRVLTNHHSADGVFLRRHAKALIQEFHITTRLGHLEATRVAVLALVAKHAAENLLIAQGQRNRSKNKGGKPFIARIVALERRQTAADERYETALVRLRDLAASSQRVADPLEAMLSDSRSGITRIAQSRPTMPRGRPKVPAPENGAAVAVDNYTSDGAVVPEDALGARGSHASNNIAPATGLHEAPRPPDRAGDRTLPLRRCRLCRRIPVPERAAQAVEREPLSAPCHPLGLHEDHHGAAPFPRPALGAR